MHFSINRDHVISEMTDDEATLVHIETTHYYGLNPTGTFVWNFLAARDATLDEIVDAVAAEFETQPEAIREDVARLMQDLKQEELIFER